MKFVLSILDADHLVLTTADPIPRPEILEAVRNAFDRWKADGGLLVIGDCVALDKHGLDLTLDVDGQAARDRIIVPGPGFVPFPGPSAEARHERLENGERVDG